MTPIPSTTLVGILLAPTAVAHAQTPYPVGQPLGVPEPGGFAPMSDNVTVYGGIVSAESCVYDPERQLILLMNMGVRLPNAANDAWVSKLHPDGSLHTARWIGVQPPSSAARSHPRSRSTIRLAARSPAACSTSPTATAAWGRTTRAWP